MENGTAQAIQDIKRRATLVEEDVKILHQRVNEDRARFNILIGQLQMLKWICGGGWGWILIKDIAPLIGGG